MRSTLLFLFFVFCAVLGTAQGLKLDILTVKPAGYDGDTKYFEITYKVITGNVSDTGEKIAVAIPLPNGTKVFAYLTTYEVVTAGKIARNPAQLTTINYTPTPGQQAVSHELAPVSIPSNRTLQCKTGYAYLLDTDDKVLTAFIKGIKGYAKVGDVIQYTNDRGQKGSGTILDFDISGFHSEYIFEGIPDNAVNMKVRINGIDLSNATIVSGGTVTEAVVEKKPMSTSAAKHKIKTITLEKTLENNEIKITVHNLVKFNPDSTAGDIDIFKVDYTLDYYIVDATVENKTAQPLDAGEYMLRFNFFSADGKSADEFLRIFRAGNKSNDPVKQDANKVDLNVFGGSSKIPLAQVMIKYEDTIKDYATKHKPQTEALNKPLAAGQKIRCVNATLMGVPPSYKIEGMGTWSGAFFSKKNLLFVPVKG